VRIEGQIRGLVKRSHPGDVVVTYAAGHARRSSGKRFPFVRDP
jgi:hypothetical protein